jgi:nucleoside-diphosphate-sugar epimerase
MTKRALITGLTGFTGRYLANQLRADGYEVFGTTHNTFNLAQGLYPVDLCNGTALTNFISEVKPDVVAHLAAISFVEHGDVDQIYRVNTLGTRNLLKSLVLSGHRPEVVLVASSANVYGNATIEPITEDVPLNPVNDYAVSKVAMEYMLRLWVDQLPIVVVRPFNYTGVGQSLSFLLPKIVDHFRKGAESIELGNLDVWRDFSDVRDVVNCYAKLIKHRAVGEVFNVCSGIGTSLREILTAMKLIAGYEIDVRVSSAFVRANEIKRLVGSDAKLMSALGPIEKMPLEQTLRWMYSNS